MRLWYDTIQAMFRDAFAITIPSFWSRWRTSDAWVIKTTWNAINVADCKLIRIKEKKAIVSHRIAFSNDAGAASKKSYCGHECL